MQPEFNVPVKIRSVSDNSRRSGVEVHTWLSSWLGFAFHCTFLCSAIITHVQQLAPLFQMLQTGSTDEICFLQRVLGVPRGLLPVGLAQKPSEGKRPGGTTPISLQMSELWITTYYGGVVSALSDPESCVFWPVAPGWVSQGKADSVNIDSGSGTLMDQARRSSPRPCLDQSHWGRNLEAGLAGELW